MPFCRNCKALIGVPVIHIIIFITNHCQMTNCPTVPYCLQHWARLKSPYQLRHSTERRVWCRWRWPQCQSQWPVSQRITLPLIKYCRSHVRMLWSARCSATKKTIMIHRQKCPFLVLWTDATACQRPQWLPIGKWSPAKYQTNRIRPIRRVCRNAINQSPRRHRPRWPNRRRNRKPEKFMCNRHSDQATHYIQTYADDD